MRRDDTWGGWGKEPEQPGPFPLGRGVGTAIAYSNQADIITQPTAATRAIAVQNAAPLLKVAAGELAGRMWNVSIRIDPFQDGTFPEDRQLFAVLTWSFGKLVSTAVVDISAAGAAAFPIMFDSLDIKIAYPAGAGAPTVRVTAAAGPFGEMEQSRAPRFTEFFPIKNAGPFPVDIDVPPWAQRLVFIVGGSTMSGNFRDGKGATTGQFQVNPNIGPAAWDLPNGTRTVRVTAISADTDVAFVFLLGF